MSKSSSAAGDSQNPSLTPDMAALHAYIDRIVDERIASIQGVRPSLEVRRDVLQGGDDDEGSDASDVAEAGDDGDSDDEPLPPLISRSPSLSGVDTELADTINHGLHLYRPTTSLSPTSSNLVPAQVAAAVREAMARAPTSAGGVEVVLAPGDEDEEANEANKDAPQTTSQPAPRVVAPAPPQVVTVAAAPTVLPGTVPPLPPLVPLPQPLIPGFHSLAGTPAPPPHLAVFAGPNDGPFYTVIRGTRVGVIGGWDVVSPFVTGVSGAVFQKKPTLMAAFAAYHFAYYKHSSPRYI